MDVDKADILAYLDRLSNEVTLLRRDLREIKQVFDQLPDMAEKDREVLTTFLSQIKNSVDDLKISISNLELVLNVSFKKIEESLKKELGNFLNKQLTNYFERELPKVLYVVEKVLSQKQVEFIRQVVDQRINELNNKLEKLNNINKKINAIALLMAKTEEERLKLFLLTTDQKEIKRKDLEKIFGKDVVKNVLKELEGKIDVKIV